MEVIEEVRLRPLRGLRRDILRLQWLACLAEARRTRAKAGSSGWIRTSNPPVNSCRRFRHTEHDQQRLRQIPEGDSLSCRLGNTYQYSLKAMVRGHKNGHSLRT